MLDLNWKLFGRPTTAVLLSGLFMVGVGCDQEAQQRRASAMQLTAGLAKIEEANASSPADGATVGAGRLALLEQAKSALEEAAKLGSPAQKAEAAKLLAGIDAQNAKAIAKKAELAYAQQRVQVVNLLSALETVDALAATATAAQQDPQAAIAKMDAAAAEFGQRKASLDTAIGKLENEVASLKQQIQAQQETARQAFGEKTRIESEAFVAQGDEKYATLDRAAASQREADIADVAAQELQIRLDKIEAGLVLAKRDAEMTAAAIEQFEDASQGFAEAGQDATQAVRDLRDQQHAAAEELAGRAEALVESFVRDVQEPLGAAVQRAEAAVSTLERAMSGASGATRSSLETDLIAKRLVHAQTLATAASYASSMQGSIHGMAGRSAFADSPELQQKLDAAAQPLGDKAKSLQSAAAGVVAAAKDSLADADPEDGFASAAMKTVTRLEGQVGTANAG